MRKATEDVLARTEAERMVADNALVPGEQGAENEMEAARRIVGVFEAVEFETAVSKVRGGQEINVRRLVLTSSWEVDPNGVAK